MRMTPWAAILAAAVVQLGCAEDLAPKHPDLGSSSTERVVNSDNGDGTTTTRVDARDSAAWVYLDLESRRESTSDSGTWDLAFQRFKIEVDGGTSGSGNVAVAALPGADFAALMQAPASGYLTDMADTGDAGVAGLAFETGDGWYEYDVSNHVLTPRPNVYVVRTVEASYFKLQITSYYDAAGTAGYLTFKWGAVGRP